MNKNKLTIHLKGKILINLYTWAATCRSEYGQWTPQQYKTCEDCSGSMEWTMLGLTSYFVRALDNITRIKIYSHLLIINIQDKHWNIEHTFKSSITTTFYLVKYLCHGGSLQLAGNIVVDYRLSFIVLQTGLAQIIVRCLIPISKIG